MVEQLVFVDYGGKRVTQPELELINYIQSQRDNSKREKEDRELEQRLLANHAKNVAAVSEPHLPCSTPTKQTMSRCSVSVSSD